MDDHSLAKPELSNTQIEAIVERGAPVPEKYGVGTPEYIGLQLARQNYLLGTRNKYLRFMRWAIVGLAAVVIVTTAYTGYTLERIAKKVEKQTVQLTAVFENINETISALEGNVSTYGEQIDGLRNELEKFQDQIEKQTGAIVRELVAVQKDVNDTRESLENTIGDSYK